MSFFKKIAEFFSAKKPESNTPESNVQLDKVTQASNVPVSKESIEVSATLKKQSKPATKRAPKVKVQKVETSPIIVAPKFKSVDLETKSKNELLELAKEHGAKVNARMGKAAIIAKLVK
jgi:hypothetical protein